MEIAFPLEFVVSGTPLSFQSVRSAAKSQWKDRVREASRPHLPSPHFASAARVAVTLFYFPAGPMQGDVDNIVKLVLDALCQHIYIDDRQVERVLVQKFEPDRPFSFRSPSPVLVSALQALRPQLYVKISDDPYEELA